ncbi:pilus assembly protein [Planosporangium thailandense]|uniref:Pilus assembly protein n=1 Tax=Planosporangium thailandense TaxID=765197 RepID=A0ABX0Y593_9ACTN|nr:TadE/TadG family type IV pilus assembly protein [Planosporangium thailandense]NJC73591.1 pilus assembly protein [Planosporangium thailandense]
MPAVARSTTAGMARGRRTRRDEGAAAVEMALVLPLLLFVLFGVIDFGRMLNTQLTLTEAAREGARAAALGQSADARVQAATTGLRGVTDTVTTCPATGAASANAVVTTQVRFSFVTPLAALAPLFGGNLASSITLTGRGVMPCVG